ncbi:MAG: protein phosphatase 2C domain-containing protein [Dysgonamonadaceae bacterium]|jgi:protein phosphatase|nr:protein phosphatase 2C domain-containing protein [Dysgonamonadaceae bacterium]
MNIQIQKPLFTDNVGKKADYNESISPKDGTATSDCRLFIVCNGVGSSASGETASSIACDSLQAYLNSFVDPEEDFLPEFIEKAVRYTEIRFDDYVSGNTAAKEMAVTFSMMYIAKNGVFVTHTGDCCVYQFRDGKVFFKTQKDADTFHVTDIQPNDLFMLTTGVVPQSLSDEELNWIFSSRYPYEDKIELLKKCCDLKSMDSFSAYLVPILSVDNMDPFKQVMTSLLHAFV